MFISPDEPSFLFQSINIIRYLLAIFFILMALKAFVGKQEIKEDYKRWGYPSAFRYLIGLAQLSSGVLLIFTSSTFFAAILLIVLMLGAIYTHFKNDPPKSSISAFIFLILLSLVAWQFKIPSLESLKSTAIKANIQSCQSCHDSEKVAPSLAGLKYQYMQEQISNYKTAKRGFDSQDLAGKQMRDILKTNDKESLNAILAFYATQKKRFSEQSFEGNISKGKELYLTNCKGCHAGMIGRLFTSSPEIEHQRGRYIYSQLQSFKKSWRLSSDKGKHKEKMILVSKRLSDDNLTDIVAYISSKNKVKL